VFKYYKRLIGVSPPKKEQKKEKEESVHDSLQKELQHTAPHCNTLQHMGIYI